MVGAHTVFCEIATFSHAPGGAPKCMKMLGIGIGVAVAIATGFFGPGRPIGTATAIATPIPIPICAILARIIHA